MPRRLSHAGIISSRWLTTNFPGVRTVLISGLPPHFTPTPELRVLTSCRPSGDVEMLSIFRSPVPDRFNCRCAAIGRSASYRRG